MGKYISTVSNRGQSLGEEVANSISHGLGLVAAIVGTPFLILSAIDYADVSFVVGVSIFLRHYDFAVFGIYALSCDAKRQSQIRFSGD